MAPASWPTEMIAARSAMWLKPTAANIPIACGASATNRDRWPCRCGTTIPTIWPASAGGWRDFQVSVVDLNFGCPVRQVTEKAHSGSWLLRDPDRVGTIVRRVVEACDGTPVTAKIRLGCAKPVARRSRVAQPIEEAGGGLPHGPRSRRITIFKGEADRRRSRR